MELNFLADVGGRREKFQRARNDVSRESPTSGARSKITGKTPNLHEPQYRVFRVQEDSIDQPMLRATKDVENNQMAKRQSISTQKGKELSHDVSRPSADAQYELKICEGKLKRLGLDSVEKITSTSGRKTIETNAPTLS
jgi:hypothetical protein